MLKFAKRVLWRCDSCGGPAAWTLIHGEPYYHCQRQCVGFRQLELFDGEPLPQAGVETPEGGGADEYDPSHIEINSDLPW